MSSLNITAHERAQKANRGSGVQSALNRETHYTGPNIHKNNIRALKEAQLRNRDRQRNEDKKKTAKPFKMNRFQNVGSRIAQQDEMGRRTPAGQTHGPNAKNKTFLRAKSKTKTPAAPSQPYVSQKIRTKASVPTRGELAGSQQIQHHENRNFIAANTRAAVSANPKHEKKNEKLSTKREGYGKVPAYLRERQAELELAKQQKLIDASREEIPPGMRLMPEQERLATLDVLEKNYNTIESELNRMPLVIESHKKKRHKRDLEDKLAEIQDAKKIFSRKKVYVSDD